MRILFPIRTRICTFCLFTYGRTHTEYQSLALFQELFSFVSSRVPVALSVSPSSSPRNSLTAIPNFLFSSKFTEIRRNNVSTNSSEIFGKVLRSECRALLQVRTYDTQILVSAPEIYTRVVFFRRPSVSHRTQFHPPSSSSLRAFPTIYMTLSTFTAFI